MSTCPAACTQTQLELKCDNTSVLLVLNACVLSLQEAKEHHQRALAIRQSVLREHPETAMSLQQLALCLQVRAAHGLSTA